MANIKKIVTPLFLENDEGFRASEFKDRNWVRYISDDSKELKPDKCGKWMYFFNDRDFAETLCQTAVMDRVVRTAKYSNGEKGVCCFYLNYDETENHKKVILFFLENGLIRKTKAGKYYNISFKRDEQTERGEYGKNYTGEIRLSDFLDLDTGEWIGGVPPKINRPERRHKYVGVSIQTTMKLQALQNFQRLILK